MKHTSNVIIRLYKTKKTNRLHANCIGHAHEERGKIKQICKRSKFH